VKFYYGPLVKDATKTKWLSRRPPPGVLWMQNFSTDTEMRSQNANDGLFVFALPDAASLGAPYELLMQGDLTTAPTKAERAAIESQLRIAPVSGTTLGEILLNGLISGSDPEGVNAVRSLQPESDTWRLVGPGGALVEKPLDLDDAEADNFKALVQSQYRALLEVDPDAAAKHLGALEEKYARTDAETWAVPADLKVSAVKGQPLTQITDNFNRANSNGLGAGTTLVEGTSTEIGVNANQAAVLGSGAFDGGAVRYDAALSSADHWSQADIAAITDTAIVGVFARMDTGAAGAHSGYTFQHIVGFGVTVCEIYCWNAGTENLISSTVSDVPSVGNQIKLQVTGSSLVGSRAGVSKIALTDTTLAGGLRAGFRLLRNDGAGHVGDARLDNWLADDGLTPPPGAGGKWWAWTRYGAVAHV
jgi:hypothetical protein